MLAPHAMMYFEWRNCSGSVPSFIPRTEMMPASPAAEQIDLSKQEAPMRWKKRLSIEAPFRAPRVPPYEYGRIASLPKSREINLKRCEISSRASFHEIRCQMSDWG